MEYVSILISMISNKKKNKNKKIEIYGNKTSKVIQKAM